MKKIYIPAIALFYVISLCTYGQDVITGVEYVFDYYDVTPAEGEEGCLYVSGTNTGATGGNLTNVMFFQVLNLQRGVTYTFDGAYKDFRTNNYWTEVWVGGNEPQEGSDYDAAMGAVLVSAFKSKNWEAACLTDTFDGTFLNDACVAGITNQVFFEGEGDTMVYFGFRSGIWDDQGSEYTFEVYIDNISLTAEGTSVNDGVNTNQFVIAPNPFNEHITISSATRIKEISVVDVTGQQVYHQSNVKSSSLVINLSDAESGIYFIRLTDWKGNTYIGKSIKL